MHDMTQAELAQRLVERTSWNVDRSVIARIEAGGRAVTIDELFALALALDTTPLFLVTPADESELMTIDGRRPLTSDRVRKWIWAELRLWEQDHDAWTASGDAATVTTDRHDAELGRLGQRIAELHGVDSPFDIPPDSQLPADRQALADNLALEFAVVGTRQFHELAFGKWNDSDLEVATRQMTATPDSTARFAATAQRLWGRRAVDELSQRNQSQGLTHHSASSAETARENADRMLQNLRAVIGELTASAQ